MCKIEREYKGEWVRALYLLTRNGCCQTHQTFPCAQKLLSDRGSVNPAVQHTLTSRSRHRDNMFRATRLASQYGQRWISQCCFFSFIRCRVARARSANVMNYELRFVFLFERSCRKQVACAVLCCPFVSL